MKTKDKPRIWTCAHCGHRFEGRKRKYCSDDCRRQANRLASFADRNCLHCGQSLAGTHLHKFCSDECRTEHQHPEWFIERTCEYCSAQFLPNKMKHGVQRFCSEECQRQWWVENRDQGKVYTYACQNCGKAYQTNFSNRDTCCSRECGAEWIGKLNSERALTEKECKSCGQVFETIQSGSDYCSDECRERGVRRVCTVCGSVFFGTENAMYCSKKCKNKENRKRFRQFKKSIGRNSGRIENLVCKECGKDFRHKVHNQIPDFCSKRCARRNWKKTHPEIVKLMKARDRHKRRARKYGNGPVDNINPITVYERDGWRCGICGKKVDPTLKFPHLYSATLDHIIPLAKGGTHTLGNVQLAHFVCNSIKSDIGGGQLRLGLDAEQMGMTSHAN